jgi:glycerol-3-phosphate acyltransferase
VHPHNQHLLIERSHIHSSLLILLLTFLKEYLQVPTAAAVAEREMKTAWGFYIGLIEGDDEDYEAMQLVETTTMTTTSAREGGTSDVVGFSVAACRLRGVSSAAPSRPFARS